MTKKTHPRQFVSQSDNFASNFGEVNRSSAIFWVRQDSALETTVSLSDYWRYKNSLDVTVQATLRDLSGQIVQRNLIDFSNSMVFNYRPPQDFEGSVEIEALSASNLRIPYAAVMAVYEASASVSMVHAYSRAYSPTEINEGRVISAGEESCWTIRESEEATSFAVIHNGAGKQGCQNVRLGIRNWRGVEHSVEFRLDGLEPFQTHVFEPRKHFERLIDFLEGQPGNARVSFMLNGGFSRMLCGIRLLDDSQWQVTHSNFDYSTHQTDLVTAGEPVGYMRTPHILGRFRQEVVVYPDSHQGRYTSLCDGRLRPFSTGDIHRLRFDDCTSRFVEIRRTDGNIPSRVVTAIRVEGGSAVIPAECSLGVIHRMQPAKHFHWMLVSERLESQICWVDLKEIYGGTPDDARLVFRLHTPDNKEPRDKTFTVRDLPSEQTIRLTSLYGCGCLGENYGYLSVWCSYGGFMFFSTLEKSASITVEHAF